MSAESWSNRFHLEKGVRKTATSPNKAMGQDGTKPAYLPQNFNSAIPDNVYKQIKEWHAVTSKYPKVDTDTAFLKDWKYKIPKPPERAKAVRAVTIPRRIGTMERRIGTMDKEWDNIKNQLRRAETQNSRMTEKLHDLDISTSRSRSRSPRGKDRDRGCYRFPSPPLVHVQLIEEDALVQGIVLIKTNSSQHKIQLQSIGRIPRGNVPILAAD